MVAAAGGEPLNARLAVIAEMNGPALLSLRLAETQIEEARDEANRPTVGRKLKFDLEIEARRAVELE